jgi:hypothetical protein
MPGDQNVQIPLSLFRKITHFFTCVSFGGYTFPALYDFDCIQAELLEKQAKMNLRTAYTKTILAKDDNQKQQAFADYQKLKNRRQH